jgi:hypothetical protein
VERAQGKDRRRKAELTKKNEIWCFPPLFHRYASRNSVDAMHLMCNKFIHSHWARQQRKEGKKMEI